MKKIKKTLLSILLAFALIFSLAGCSTGNQESDSRKIEKSDISAVSSHLNGFVSFFSYFSNKNSGSTSKRLSETDLTEKSSASNKGLHSEIREIENFWQAYNGGRKLDLLLVFDVLDDVDSLEHEEDKEVVNELGFLPGYSLCIFENSEEAIISLTMVDLNNSLIYTWCMYNENEEDDDYGSVCSFNSERTDEAYTVLESVLEYDLSQQTLVFKSIENKLVPADGNPYFNGGSIPNGYADVSEDLDEDIYYEKTDASRKISSRLRDEIYEEEIKNYQEPETNEVTSEKATDTDNDYETDLNLDYYTSGTWYVECDRYDED
ncbi:MAG: hypothetical protein LIO46_04010, partial [Clostridiales bacterium]|nr:hypothetical protein [Clostridiales bacterium]